MCTIYCLECEILWYGWNPNFGLVCPFDQVQTPVTLFKSLNAILIKKKKKKISQCNLSDLAPTHKRHCC